MVCESGAIVSTQVTSQYKCRVAKDRLFDGTAHALVLGCNQIGVPLADGISSSFSIRKVQFTSVIRFRDDAGVVFVDCEAPLMQLLTRS